MVAEIQQLATLALVPLSAFSGPALAQSFAKPDGTPAARVAGAALTWTAAFGLVLTLIFGIAAPFLLPRDWNFDARQLVVTAGLAMVLTALANVATQTLVFRERLRSSTRLQLLSVGVTTVTAVLCTWKFGVVGQFTAMAIAAAVVLPSYLVVAGRSGEWPRRREDFAPDRKYLRTALSLGATSLVAGAALQGALYTIRWRLELTGGATLNGQFQASWAIGSMYLSMLLSGIATFAFPRFAKATSVEELQAEVDTTTAFVARFAPPVVLMATALCGIGIHLLYSASFDPAIEVLRWQLAGDVAKCFAWAYAGPLLYRGKLRTFLVTEFIVAGLLAGLTWVLVPRTGLAGAGQAYTAAYVAYLGVTAVAARTSLGVTARRRDLLVGLASTAILVSVAVFQDSLTPKLISILVSVMWLWRTGALRQLPARLRERFRNHA